MRRTFELGHAAPHALLQRARLGLGVVQARLEVGDPHLGGLGPASLLLRPRGDLLEARGEAALLELGVAQLVGVGLQPRRQLLAVRLAVLQPRGQVLHLGLEPLGVGRGVVEGALGLMAARLDLAQGLALVAGPRELLVGVRAEDVAGDAGQQGDGAGIDGLEPAEDGDAGEKPEDQRQPGRQRESIVHSRVGGDCKERPGEPPGRGAAMVCAKTLWWSARSAGGG
ncbi:hypothetical protein [Nannocystis pusilla]|uniref:hypothetical protein n=1 Tax=Nannocystis pusilla TaxID=889268 RepID=UPI003DA59A3F